MSSGVCGIPEYLEIALGSDIQMLEKKKICKKNASFLFHSVIFIVEQAQGRVVKLDCMAKELELPNFVAIGYHTFVLILAHISVENFRYRFCILEAPQQAKIVTLCTRRHV